MPEPGPRAVYRHRVVTRVWHWVNLICLVLLIGSGLQIFNAYPRLHWAKAGADADPAVMEIVPEQSADGAVKGVVKLGGKTVLTATGVLGVSEVDGQLQARAFPSWVTVPSNADLATGRKVHFFFAWLLVFAFATNLVHAAVSRHLTRDLLPTRDEVRPRRLWDDIREHLKLRPPHGEEALRYNPLQKLAYLAVLFVLLPAMVLSGLTMMPGMDAAWPFLLDLFGGRQAARTAHFVTMNLLLLFAAVHVFQVFLVGPVRSVRSMITGWWTVREGKS